MPKGPQPKPGTLTHSEASKRVGLSPTTYKRFLSTGAIQAIVGIPASERYIPQQLLARHGEAIAALGNPDIRAARGGAPKKRETERESGFQQAIDEARGAKGQLSRSVTQRLKGKEDQLPDDVRQILQRHREIVKQTERATVAAWYDRRMAPRKAEAITALRSADVGRVPKWALVTLRYEKNLPADLAVKRDEDAVLKEQAKKRRQRAPARAQMVADAIKVIESGKPGKYPVTAVRLLNGEPGIPRTIKQRLIEHAQIIESVRTERSRAKAFARNSARVQRNMRQAIEDARARAQWPLPKWTVRRLNAQKRLPSDVRKILAEHKAEVKRQEEEADRLRARKASSKPKGPVAAPKSARPLSAADLERVPKLQLQIAELTRDLSLSMNGHGGEISAKYRPMLSEKGMKEAIAASQLPAHDVVIIRKRNALQEELNNILGVDNIETPRTGSSKGFDY